VILINQFHILAKLDKQNAADYERDAKALSHGFSLNYEFLDYLSSEMPVENCRFVMDVLSMYDGMQRSWKALKTKGGITKQQITYRGFDGNNETQHMSYSQFVVNDCGRFDYMGIKDHNSHMESIPGYLRMLEKWSEFKRSNTMSSEQLRALIEASYHPG
jgi:uncharacterized protein YfbU (UPF0304 family)